MRPGFLGEIEKDMPIGRITRQIHKYYKQKQKESLKGSFNVWMNLYGRPMAKELWKDQYTMARERNFFAKARAKDPQDAGVKSVQEVKKIADKLIKTEKTQEKIQKDIDKKLARGNVAAASQLMVTEKQMQKKAEIIRGQLNTRVTEGIELAKAKKSGEKAKLEVDFKKKELAEKFPNMLSFWAKHDAMYESRRANIILKHKKAEIKDEQERAKLKQLLPSLEKDAKSERLRKQAAARRITHAHETAKFDEAEAGRVQAREKTAK